MDDLHHDRLAGAIKLAAETARRVSETNQIHQIYSWDIDEWLFVVIDSVDETWTCLLYTGGRIIDFTDEFAQAPTPKIVYKEDALV